MTLLGVLARTGVGRVAKQHRPRHLNRAERIPQIVRDDGEDIFARLRGVPGLPEQARVVDGER